MEKLNIIVTVLNFLNFVWEYRQFQGLLSLSYVRFWQYRL